MSDTRIKPSATGYKVRWKELSVVRAADGTESRRWIERSRVLPTHAAAVEFLAEIRLASARGERWEDARAVAVGTIREVALGWAAAAVAGGSPLATQRFRASMMSSWLRWLDAMGEDDRGARRPVTDLSVGLLEQYAASLPSEGRAADTRHRKVLAVEHSWAWAAERPETYPGVPAPRRVSGTGGAAPRPDPAYATGSPTWAEVDSMIEHLGTEQARRAAILMRYSGLRVAQVAAMRWADIDLDRRVWWIPTGAGSKGNARRAIPIAEPLAAEIAGWGVREGYVLPGGHAGHRSAPGLSAALDRAWRASGVSESKWGVDESQPGARAHASPAHCIRRTVIGGLLRSGVDLATADLYVGHGMSPVLAAYVAQGSPEESPLWAAFARAAASIPDHRAANNVRRLAAHEG